MQPRPVLSTVPLPVPMMPDRWVGASVDGATVTVRDLAGGLVDRVSVPVSTGEGGTAVSGVLMQDGAVVVNECCEPAPGRWYRWLLDTGDLVEGAWFGQVTDMDAAGRLLAVDPNGFFVQVADPEGEILAKWPSGEDGAPGVVPEDGAWSPDGSFVAFVGSLPTDEVALSVFGLEAIRLKDASVLDRGPSDGVHPAFPVVDREGRAWYVLVDESSQIPTADGGLVPETVGGKVVDGRTGEVVDKVAYDGSVVDQSIDPSGTYLIITYADGRVVWRSTDGDTGTLADGGYVSADWGGV